MKNCLVRSQLGCLSLLVFLLQAIPVSSAEKPGSITGVVRYTGTVPPLGSAPASFVPG